MRGYREKREREKEIEAGGKRYEKNPEKRLRPPGTGVFLTRGQKVELGGLWKQRGRKRGEGGGRGKKG